MRFKVITLVAAAFMLTACGTTSEDTGDATGAGTGASTSGMTSGVSTMEGPAPGTQEDLVVNVGDRVFFDFDSSALRPDARDTVEGLAAWMNNRPSTTIIIEGHADERGTREYNLALGDRRANAVYDYLLALGIPSGRLSTISYGKERPAVLGSNEAAWAQNRRAVFVVN